jgi:archaellum biogenesis ATPase FlaH
LNREMNSGVKSTFFPWFNRLLKGFRRGEFTIFTGPTGSGKTTFLSQFSLDFAKGGVPTLWCSFELKNEVLLSTMLSQFAGVDLHREKHRFDFYADQFEKIPMYFQTYFGSTHVDDIITMIDYAIYTHDIGHIVIDNLQFMLSGQGRGIEKFDMQDDVVSKLRNLATQHNVHITLVIHPRKGEDGLDLSMSSIFGTAKSTQEADNVMMLQLREKYRVLDLKKNRFDGEVGKSSLWFDRSTKRFEQITAKEIEELLSGGKLSTILERKNREVKEDLDEQSNRLNQEIVKIEHEAPVMKINREQKSIIEGNVKKTKLRFTEEAYRKLSQIKYSQSTIIPTEAEERISMVLHSEVASEEEGPTSFHHAEAKSRSNESYDPFEIKVEDSKVINDFSKEDAKQPEKVERLSEPPKRKGNKNILSGFHTIEETKLVDNLYDGDVLYTYNDMVQELLEKGPSARKIPKRNNGGVKMTQGKEKNDDGNDV